MTLPVAHLWWIPALPLLAAGVITFLPRGARRLAAALAIAALAASLALALAALGTLLAAPPGTRLIHNFTWFEVGAGAVPLGWVLDAMTALMLVMVAGVGLLIFIFSLGYMHEDPNAARFFGFLSLFAAAMLGLVAANSLLLLFICWELVGLASYLLIGFWFHRPAAAAAARKAFVMTRVGDLALLLGLLWLYDATGTVLFYDGGAGCLEAGPLGALAAPVAGGAWPVATAIGLLLFAGAVGKSGQLPLHGWLPDAMEGPTPVSALIHAATMVAAGVFLAARVFPLLALDGGIPEVPVRTLTIVAWTGALTGLAGALMAMAQHDIKRVLAYSTISQLGTMMLAVGVGAWTAALFHLLTHACFKALLFLGAGSVIQAAAHEQDIRRLGGLAGRQRTTFIAFAIGMMALAGVPFLFSGFWSKEAILHAAGSWEVSSGPAILALAGAGLTAFYMTRLLAEVFWGRPRSAAAAQANESPAVMTVPLLLLAAASVLAGFLGTPGWDWLPAFLEGRPPVFAPARAFTEGGALMFGSILLVGAGLGLGWWAYGRRPRATPAAADPLQQAAPALFGWLADRMGFDRLLDRTVVRAHGALARLSDALDRWVWDGTVRAAAALGTVTGLAGRQTDEDAVDGAFDAGCEGLRRGGRTYSRRQTGEAHGYLRALAAAFVLLALLLVLGGAR